MPAAAVADPSAVTLAPAHHRAIWTNAVLWTAGHTLTSGAFLSYFANDLGASSLLLALLAAAPELVGFSGLWAGHLVRWFGKRRRAWIVTTILARAFTLAIPFVGSPMFGLPREHAPWALLALVILSQFLQGFATTLYFAWLADLTPSSGWGRLFAGRNMATLLVQMSVPLLGARLRDSWKQSLAADDLWTAYAVVFAIGVGVLIASVVPMLLIPSGSHAHASAISATATSWRSLLAPSSIRWLLAHSWCLALANGLTQAAFFKYQIGIVGLSLTGYFVLVDAMLGVQLVTSWLAGRCRTTHDHRRALFWGSLVASAALPFWFLASREQWGWLIGAFICWGAFGAVNVAGPNLMFSLCTPEQTTRGFALFRQMAGTLAGVSGIVGGLLLDRWLGTGFVTAETPLWPFHLLFAISFVGRVLAALLVLAIPLDHATPFHPTNP